MKKTIRVLPAALALAGILMLAGCGGLSESEMSERIAEKLVPGDSYVMSELLYSDGNSEALTPGLKYEYTADGGITITDAMTGDAIESAGGAETHASSVSKDEWSERFPVGLAPELEGFDKCIECSVSDKYRFYLMDDEIWLGVYDGAQQGVKDSGTLAALFKLQKQ